MVDNSKVSNPHNLSAAGLARVASALNGEISPGDLTGHEQEEFFDRFSDAMAHGSPAEDAFWADRQARGLGVGMDEQGYMAYGRPGGRSVRGMFVGQGDFPKQVNAWDLTAEGLARVARALGGFMAVDDLSPTEQETFYDQASEFVPKDSLKEKALWAERDQRGHGVRC